MNQKVLNISLPKERSLKQLKSFTFLQKIIGEIELFVKNNDNFLLINIKENLIRDYLIQAASNTLEPKPIIIDLKEQNFDLEPFKDSLVLIKNLSSEFLNHESELFLFNAFNFCLDQNTKILFSSNDFVKNLKINLPDLESRLNTILPMEMPNPSENEKMNLINFELDQRGLKINQKEMKYIFTYHSRDLNSLLKLAEKLDEISYKEKKAISIGLIKKII